MLGKEAIYIAIQQSLSKDDTDAKERDWKDATRYRTGDRGDLLLRIPIPPQATAAPQPNATPPSPAPNQQPLPEGATVSSLSLWIGNHEAKGVFTSRHKADSAYREIVGYQHRDPSVVHWQEGNKVVVRVFPIDPNTPRRFKIGITAPLESR